MRQEWRQEWSASVARSTVEGICSRYMPEMPPIDIGAYLLDALMEIGPTVPAGMGAGVIDWTQIDAWCNRTGIDLQPWESRFIRRLSGEYLTQAHKAEKRDCPAPWSV